MLMIVNSNTFMTRKLRNISDHTSFSSRSWAFKQYWKLCSWNGS